jgi:hypothetical protein
LILKKRRGKIAPSLKSPIFKEKEKEKKRMNSIRGFDNRKRYKLFVS